MPTIVVVGSDNEVEHPEEKEEKANPLKDVVLQSISSSVNFKDIIQQMTSEDVESYSENLNDLENALEGDSFNEEPEDFEPVDDILNNRIENSISGIYSKPRVSKLEDEEDMLDREIRDMRRSAEGITDELDGLIDRGGKPSTTVRTEYISDSPVDHRTGSPNEPIISKKVT